MDVAVVTQGLLATFAADDAALAANLAGIVASVESRRLLDGRLHATEASILAIQKWIKRINSLILSGDSASRWCGLNLLRSALRQCTPGVFAESSPAWMTAVLQILKRPAEPPRAHQCAVEVGGHILSIASLTPDQRRDMAAAHVPRFVAICIELAGSQSPTATRIASFSALAVCLDSFPGAMRPHFDSVEAICASSAFDQCASVRKAAVQTLAKAPLAAPLPANSGQSGDGSQQPQQPKDAHTGPQGTAWKAQMGSFVAYMHDVLTAAHATVPKQSGVAVSGRAKLSDRLNAASPVAPGSPAAPFQFETACDAATAMLLCDAPFAVSIPTADVLALAARTLSWDDRALGALRGGMLDVPGLLVARFHRAVIELVHALVLSCGSNLMTHANAIWRLCAKALSATRSDSVDRDSRRLRASAYACVALLTDTCGPSASVASVDEIVAAAVSDIRLTSDAASKSGEDASKNANRVRPGKRRKLEEASAPIATDGQTGTTGHLVTLEALRALPSVINGYSAGLPGPTRRLIEDALVTCAASIQPCIGLPSTIPAPYSLPQCRAALVTALASALLAFSTLNQTRVHAIFALISAETKDASLEVRAAAVDALLSLDAIVHPRLPVPRRHMAPESDGSSRDAPGGQSTDYNNAAGAGGGFGARGLGWSTMQPSADNYAPPKVDATGAPSDEPMEDADARVDVASGVPASTTRVGGALVSGVAATLPAVHAPRLDDAANPPFNVHSHADAAPKSAPSAMDVDPAHAHAPSQTLVASHTAPISATAATVVQPGTTRSHNTLPTSDRKRTVSDREEGNDDDEAMPEIVDCGPDDD